MYSHSLALHVSKRIVSTGYCRSWCVRLKMFTCRCLAAPNAISTCRNRPCLCCMYISVFLVLLIILSRAHFCLFLPVYLPVYYADGLNATSFVIQRQVEVCVYVFKIRHGRCMDATNSESLKYLMIASNNLPAMSCLMLGAE